MPEPTSPVKFDSTKIVRYCEKLPDYYLTQLARLVASEIRKRKQEWEAAEFRRQNPEKQPTWVKAKGK